MMLNRIIPAALLLVSAGVFAQTMKLDHWTSAQLLGRAQHLQQLAAQGDGSASEALDKYSRHYSMLAFRSRSGGGELHQNYADLFYILDGRATIVSGGQVEDAKTTAAGEVRGSGVANGTRQEVNAGDVVHIPAGVPHQMLLPAGGTITYFVVKIQEKD
jgi:mannose-6-phosphate isomerase-like protein (cupin superfamily)